MEVTVLFFGELATVVGAKKIAMQNLEDSEQLNEYILQQYPSLKNKKYRIAVNQQLINGNQILKNGDEIALLPPFAGG